MHVFIAILVTAAVCLPAGMYIWYRFGSHLRSEAQAVGAAVTKFTGNKASGK